MNRPSYLRLGSTILWIGCALAFIPLGYSEVPTGKTQSFTKFTEGSLRGRPKLSELAQLDEDDKSALVRLFKEEALTNKARLAWGIAHLGGDEVLEVLKQPLEFDYRGRKLGFEGESAMLEILRAIGYLGQRSEAAYQYLTSSIAPDVWRQRITWRRKENTQSAAEVRFTGYALSAVAMTGNTNSMAAIAAVVKRIEENKDEMKVIAGLVVDSVFFLWFINEKGREGLIEAFTESTHMLEDFRAFLRTESGRAWKNWSYRITGIERPED